MCIIYLLKINNVLLFKISTDNLRIGYRWWGPAKLWKILSLSVDYSIDGAWSTLTFGVVSIRYMHSFIHSGFLSMTWNPFRSHKTNDRYFIGRLNKYYKKLACRKFYPRTLAQTSCCLCLVLRMLIGINALMVMPFGSLSCSSCVGVASWTVFGSTPLTLA